MEAMIYSTRNNETGVFGCLVVEYHEMDPCISCGQPVRSASAGGTAICAYCDSGPLLIDYETSMSNQKAAYKNDPYAHWRNAYRQTHFEDREEAMAYIYRVLPQSVYGKIYARGLPH